MKRILFASSMLWFALAGVGNAQGSASTATASEHYSQAQVNQLVRDAHSTEQYKALADYFLDRQNKYLRQAADEKQEWVRRSQNVTVLAAKYPRPVDSSRYRYEYFTYKAAQAKELAERFGKLAAPAPVDK